MKVTINQLRLIIKEEVSRMLRENDADYAWVAFEDAVEAAKEKAERAPTLGMLGSLFYDYFNPLVEAFPGNTDLEDIQKEIRGVLNDIPSIEEQKKIIDGLKGRVMDALEIEKPRSY